MCFSDQKVFQRGEEVPNAGPCEECRCEPPSIVCQMLKCPVNNNGCRTIQRPNHCCPDYNCGTFSSTIPGWLISTKIKYFLAGFSFKSSLALPQSLKENLLIRVTKVTSNSVNRRPVKTTNKLAPTYTYVQFGLAIWLVSHSRDKTKNTPNLLCFPIFN